MSSVTLLILVLALVIGLLLIFGIWYALTYNSLVHLRERIRNAWSQIDVQLKRRYDLIPNLVETVKGYARHEQETLENVVKARQIAIDASGVKEQQEAENFLTSTLRSLFALSEAYPDLKANQNFLMLQEELSGTEGKIAFARQHYNDVVSRYNATIKSFPANLIASSAGFTEEPYFEIEEFAREVPRVQF